MAEELTYIVERWGMRTHLRMGQAAAASLPKTPKIFPVQF